MSAWINRFQDVIVVFDQLNLSAFGMSKNGWTPDIVKVSDIMKIVFSVFNDATYQVGSSSQSWRW